MTVSDTPQSALVEAAAKPASRLSVSVGFALRFLVAAAAIGIVMSLSNVNIGSIGQGLGLAGVGIGVYLSFRVLQFPDLTVDGALPIGGAVAAAMIVGGVAAELTLPAALLAGALTGMVTALIHVVLRVEGLLASIIVMTGAYTITLWTMGTSNIPLLNERTILTPYQPAMREFVIATFGDEARRQSNNLVEIGVFAVIIVLVIVILNWFLHTELGLTLRAAGKNSQMVRALGVSDKRMIIIGLMLSNGLAGLAGALLVQQLGFADVQMGFGMIVRGLASVMIGEVLLRPRTVGQGIIAAVFGMVTFEVLRAWVFAALDLEAEAVRLVSALVVLLALAAPTLIERYRAWKHRREAAHAEN